MNLVNVFEARPGMMLAREVKSKEGRLLLTAGTLLGEKEIRILRMWGILEIQVVPGADTMDSGNRGEFGDEIVDFMVQWFRHNNRDDPVVRCLFDLAGEWFERRPELFQTLVSRLGAPREDEVPQGDVLQEIRKADPVGLLDDAVKLPALPRIYFEIDAAVKNPRCSGKEIADIVSKDTSLSATLLRIVNSAYFGFREKIDSLSFAALALGTDQICSLAMGITMIKYFKGLPGRAPDMKAFWHHSLGCAVFARNLATHISGVDGEHLFTGGLLHDIGRLVFLSYFPEATGAALAIAGTENRDLVRVESEFFMVDHAQFGSLLADKWNFSHGISAMIRDHHMAFQGVPEKEIAVVYFSNWMVSALGIGFSGDIALPALNKYAWAAMGMPAAALVPVIRQTERQIEEAIRFFYG